MGEPVEQFGRYLVYEQLGTGGMAHVHRAEVIGVDGFRKAVALKRMLPGIASNAEMVKSFVREARLASHLRHANVAQTYELGKVDDVYFIAMELVTGRNLREIFKHCAQTTGTIPVPIALNILNQICDALDYAHNLCDDLGTPLGIIHRDVTPSNIILSEQGIAKLIDFGIAKASAAGMQTMSGTIKGKFGYMAPEYLAGRIDARADLFAIGVIAHELLTNRPLFTAGDDMETLTRVQHMEIPPPSRRNPDVPTQIDDLVMTALARDPDRRWQHATAMRAALTTTTKQLGLEAVNSEVVEWVGWVYEQTKKNIFAAPPRSGDPSTTELTRSSDTDAGATLTSNDMVPRIEIAQTTSFLADEVVPTTIRRSEPKLAMPPSGSNNALTAPREVVVPRPPTPTPTPTLAPAPPAKPGRRVGFVLLVLLVTAVASATVVYFALL